MNLSSTLIKLAGKPGIPNLVFVRGLPGVGKSTWAKKMLPSHTLVEADQFFERSGGYKFDPALIGDAHADAKARMVAALKSGKDVTVANTFTKNWELKNYLDEVGNIKTKTRVFSLGNKPAYKSVHGVPDAALQAMGERWEDIPGEKLLKKSSLSSTLIKLAQTLAEAHNEMIGKRRGYPFSAVTSELGELIRDRNREELSDVAWTTQSYLYSKGLLPGWMPAMGEMSLNKYRARDAFMKGEMAAHGLRHSRAFNGGGSNWVKPDKVTKAFAAAGKTLTARQAEAIAGRYRKQLTEQGGH